MSEALVGLALMMVLALLRIPIAIAMGVVGFLGVAYLRDWNFAPALAMTQVRLYETGRNYTLSVVPLFILMGNFVTRAGMSQELFRAANTCIGHLRGGLAMATVCACAGFGAICGSSIATAATMAKVAYPAMNELGYSDRLSTGAIAGGGTLGILIPPSTIMVIYGVLTETNIGKLFAAGILPGALMFAEFVNYTSMPDDLKTLVTAFNLSPIMVVAAICAIYVILGTAMEELSMILLTVPVFFPLILHLGLDPVWFGILIVVVVEIGLISPPVGMNLFVLNTLLPQVPTRTIFRGVLPFMMADCVRLAILVAFPIISTYLPSLMK